MIHNEIVIYALIGVSFLLTVLCIRSSNKNNKLFEQNSDLRNKILSMTSSVEEAKQIKTQFDNLNSQISEMRGRVIEAEKRSKDAKDISDNAKDIVFNVKPGYKGLVPGYSLYWTADKKSFTVNYEVEILEVTDKKLKVKGYNFTSEDRKAMEPGNKISILRHVDEQWLDKSKVEIIIDDAMRRDLKLNEILKDGN